MTKERISRRPSTSPCYYTISSHKVSGPQCLFRRHPADDGTSLDVTFLALFCPLLFYDIETYLSIHPHPPTHSSIYLPIPFSPYLFDFNPLYLDQTNFQFLSYSHAKLRSYDVSTLPSKQLFSTRRTYSGSKIPSSFRDSFADPCLQ